ncbi:MAG: isocitrate/isopropylmalate family dehydrogenase, partial [Nitrosopumilaceae archaeon]
MYKISLITGDGIGPELSQSAISVLNTINDKTDVKFEITKLLAGDIALKEKGKALPEETLETIKSSDVCIKVKHSSQNHNYVSCTFSNWCLETNIRTF